MLERVAISAMTSKALAPKQRARNTTVAWKILMAVTGVFFAVFILLHMYGNLKMLAGPEAYDGYAEWMRQAFYPVLPHGGMLWILRVGLLVSLAIHGYAAFKLWARARAARGSSYVKRTTLGTSYAVRTMRWGAVILLLFVAFHLAQFTWLVINLGADYSAMGPYDRMVFTFQQWYWVAAYLLVMVVLGLHLRHGLWSSLATLGGNRQKWQGTINATAILIAGGVVVGFMLPPVLIFLGVIN